METLSRFLIIFWCVCLQDSVSFCLNDTEFDRMPALFTLDQWDQCLRYHGTYCVAKFDLVADSTNELIQLIHKYSEHNPKHYNHTYIERGICLNNTCADFIKGKSVDTKEDLIRVLNDCINETIWKEYGIQTNLAELYSCNGDQAAKIEPDWLEWTVLAVVIALVVANLVGTCYDVTVPEIENGNSNNKGRMYLLSFSVIRNWKDLFKIYTAAQDDRIRRIVGFYGIKFYASLLVVMLHVQMLYGGGFIDNPHEYEKALDRVIYRMFVNGLTVVQMFFVISSFLLVYFLQIVSETTSIGWHSLPKFFILRWWRLTPPYALVVAFTASWMRHLGSGPLWDHYVTNTVANQCREYWWMHLLYIQNYDSDERMKMCSLPTWHLAADMQAFVVCVVAYMANRSYNRKWVLGILLLVGILLPAPHIWLQDLDPLVMASPEFFRALRHKTFLLMHTRGHINLVGPVMGMITGYIIYDWQKQGVDLSKNKFCRFFCWLTVPASFGIFYTGYAFSEGGSTPLAARVAYGMMLRPVFCAVCAFMILVLVMKCGENFRALWEWPPLKVAGKLSYAVFLLHMPFIHVLLGNRTQLERSSFYNLTVTSAGVFLLSYLAALPFYILVEAPLVRVMKVYTALASKDHTD